MEYKKFWAKLNKWLDQHERLSMNDMNDIKGRQELFEMASEQMTPDIKGSIYNDDFLFEYFEWLDQWVKWLKANP